MSAVLIVDDSQTQAEHLRMLLEDEGFQVSCQSSAHAALEALALQPPDLIVSDIVMPGMNGFEFCRTIKAHQAWRKIPVMLVTALNDPLEMINALECGADNFITKPFDPAYLLNRVRALLSSHPAEQHLRVETVVELTFMGRPFRINYDRQQILSMLISSFEDVVAKNEELKQAHARLAAAKTGVDRDLLETRARVSAVYEAIPDAIIVQDLERRVVTCNPACTALFGYREDEVVGNTVNLLYAQGPQTEVGRNQEMVYRRKDGTAFTGESKLTPMLAPSGEQVGYVKVIRDVTARLQLEEEFRQSQKMEAVGRLAGGVAHDFNNLLTVIMGGAELLRQMLQESRPAVPWEEELQSVTDAAERAAALTRQLLTISRRQVSQEERFNLNDAVSSMQQLLKRLIGEDVILEMSLCPEALWVLGDPGQLTQVILNLVVNARDAMPDGGRVQVSTATTRLSTGDVPQFELENGTYCVLAISDTGCGIDKQVRDRIFDPFFTTKSTGTGLGLSTVYSIVQRARGRVWVYSEPGQGTTFKVYLPSAQDAPLAVRTAQTQPAVAAGRQKTLLVVEDDDKVRKLARRALEQKDYIVLEAAEGRQALELARTHPGPIHLMLTDMVMPEMNGRDLSKSVTELRPNIKVVYTSGYTEASFRYRDPSEGKPWFLEKPFSVEALANKISEVLDAPARQEERAG